MSAAPPALLRRLLERALPAEVRDDIVGDLDEVYGARRARGGAARAALWYAGQAVAIAGRFGAERLRDALSLSGTSIGLDLKLGLRMLVKYPMLTLIGGIAITVATAIGVGASEFVRDMVTPELPLEEGDRIVRLYHNDTEAGESAAASLYDLQVWRESLSSLQDLGAYATMEQGIVTDRGEAGTVSLARISASAFRLTRVPPWMGRFLLEADERPGAPAVVVLGYGAWQTLLGGDPHAVGRTVQLGGTPTTVVGVMPEGYAFPQMQDAWVPLSVDPAGTQPGSAPRANLFARLAPGATLESAQSELDIAGRRAAADFPEVYARLEPRVVEFARRGSDAQMALILTGVRLLFVFLLVVSCANVATLVFARTVMREGEIAVRTSLGATRRRIVLQLFAEALVLVGGATLVGMTIAWLALGRIGRLFFVIQQAPQPPFWWNNNLSPTTVVYAGVLALVGAVMIGVVPGLKATGGSVQPRLGRLSVGGGGGLRFGGMWTVVIVLQVALSVAFLPLAVSQAGTAFANPVRAAFPAEEYITAQLGRDPLVPPRTPEERAAFLAHSAQLFEEVRDHIAADPAVRGAAVVSGLSGLNHITAPVAFEGDGSAPAEAYPYTRVLLVDPSYLALMDATVVAGRMLGPADFTPQSRSVVVNEEFVELALAGRNPVGGQLRFPERDPEAESSLVRIPAAGTSVEVVGVVRNPGIDAFGPGAHAVIYAPLELAPVSPRDVGFVGMPQAPATQLFVRLRPEAGPLAGRLYGIVSGVDPTLRLSEVGTAADAWGPVHTGERLGAWVFMAVAAIVLMLSVAGIYALMSFTVSRRTREIAIRIAVGARRGQIVSTVFGRAALQLLAGVALGGLIAVPVLWDGVVDEGQRSLVIVSAVLLAAGLAACLVPVRRALAIEPAAAVKAE
ncbi:MAG TPA: ABC transporter permease [Longimicrobiales bacterium]|nr:ABC transporter permease [Longimicrobiales bacterium]